MINIDGYLRDVRNNVVSIIKQQSYEPIYMWGFLLKEYQFDNVEHIKPCKIKIHLNSNGNKKIDKYGFYSVDNGEYNVTFYTPIKNLTFKDNIYVGEVGAGRDGKKMLIRSAYISSDYDKCIDEYNKVLFKYTKKLYNKTKTIQSKIDKLNSYVNKL